MKSVTDKYLDKELAETESDAIVMPPDYQEYLDNLQSDEKEEILWEQPL